MQRKPKTRPAVPTKQASRYRAGQVPENYVDDLSDEEEEEEEAEEVRQELKHGHGSTHDATAGIKKIAISTKELSTDSKSHRDNRQSQKAKEDEEEEDRSRARMKMKQLALQQQREQEALEQSRKTKVTAKESSGEEEEGDEDEEEDEESSEYETDSEDEDEESYGRPKMPKPMFIPKGHRETVLQQEKLEQEAEERERKLEEEEEERRMQSEHILSEQLKREKQEAAKRDLADETAVDDTDGVDTEGEYEAWKLRELLRIKRDREERIAREREEEELERLRSIPEHIRLKDDLKRAEESRNQEKGQQAYLQKYYHKGAFYQDSQDEIFQRNYSAAVEDEVQDRSLLPEVMQVKNFGKAGRTKWTHLTAEDTTGLDSPWGESIPKRQKTGEPKR